MRVKDAMVNDIDDLRAQYDNALQRAMRLTPAAHTVRNCPSDLQARDQAWRLVQDLEYQLQQVNNEKA